MAGGRRWEAHRGRAVGGAQTHGAVVLEEDLRVALRVVLTLLGSGTGGDRELATTEARFDQGFEPTSGAGRPRRHRCWCAHHEVALAEHNLWRLSRVCRVRKDDAVVRTLAAEEVELGHHARRRSHAAGRAEHRRPR